jgi:transcriptional regulator with XRE-family HTH domain
MGFDRFKLRQIRNEKQIRQITLAFKTGLDQGYISRLERGVDRCINPYLETLIKIADGLGCQVEDLTSEYVPTNKQEKYYRRNRRKKGEIIT